MIMLNEKSTRFLQLFLPLIAGLGMGLLFKSPFNALEKTVQPRDRAAMTGCFFYVRFIGTSVGLVSDDSNERCVDGLSESLLSVLGGRHIRHSGAGHGSLRLRLQSELDGLEDIGSYLRRNAANGGPVLRGESSLGEISLFERQVPLSVMLTPFVP